MPRDLLIFNYAEITRRAQKEGKAAGKQFRGRDLPPGGREALPGRQLIANKFDEFYAEKKARLDADRVQATAQHDENTKRLKEINEDIDEVLVNLEQHEVQWEIDSQKTIDERNNLLDSQIKNGRAKRDQLKRQASDCRVGQERLEQKVEEIDAELLEIEHGFNERRETAVHEFDVAFDKACYKLTVFQKIRRVFKGKA